MDEKDKLIKEQRAEIFRLQDKLDYARKFERIWSQWKSTENELPDYTEAYLVIWHVPSWDYSRRRLYWEILEWDEARNAWEYNAYMQRLREMGTEIEILYWMELPDADAVEELIP